MIKQCLNNYTKDQIFDQEISNTRVEFFIKKLKEKDRRWACGSFDPKSDLLHCLKMTLAKIYLGDDNNMDEQQVKIQCDRLYEKAVTIYLEGGDELTAFELPIVGFILMEVEVNTIIK